MKRAEQQNAQIKENRSEYEWAKAKCLRAGFSERWAPLAASAYLMARTTGAEPTIRQLRAHLAATYEGYEG